MMPEIFDAVVEALGDVDRVLAGQRVGDEQRLVRIRDALDLGDFGHQAFIDMLAAGGIEDHHVVAADAGGRDRALGDVDRTLAEDDRKRGDARLLAEHFELLHGGGAVDVERRHQHALLVAVLEHEGELGRRGRLARALKADHQDRRGRRAKREPFALRTQRLDEDVVDDLHHLLAGRDRADHLLADRLLADLGDEILDDGERDVGIDQRGADFGERGIDVGLGQRATAAQPVEHRPQTLLQTVEHLDPHDPLPRWAEGQQSTNAPGGAPALPGVDPGFRPGTGRDEPIRMVTI